tara:strand:- start:979 stop:1416 length:438 start_codon:yes stop_codon:yes gene_type:complete
MITFDELTSKISDWEIKFLFKVLLERKYRISHDRMPSYAEHNSFVNNHPYHIWSIVRLNEIPIGTVYIGCDNSVGIHILTEFRMHRKHVIQAVVDRFKPLTGKPSTVNRNFIFNIAVGDLEYEKDLRDCGATPLQITYQIKGKNK